MAGEVGEFRLADIILFASILVGALSNYYATRERIRVLETKVEPLVRWWNRIASNAADRLFRSRSADRSQVSPIDSREQGEIKDADE